MYVDMNCMYVRVSCVQLYERAVKSVRSKAGKATQSGRLEEINDDDDDNFQFVSEIYLGV